MKCHELAKSAELSFLGDFYRRIAVRYMFMAEEILNDARARGDLAPRSAAKPISTGIAGRTGVSVRYLSTRLNLTFHCL